MNPPEDDWLNDMFDDEPLDWVWWLIAAVLVWFGLAVVSWFWR